MVKTMVGFGLLIGLRRGDLFALRWKHVRLEERCLKIEEAVYEGKFASPKTAAGVRLAPLSAVAWQLLWEWRHQTRRTAIDDLLFCTRSGLPISPNNLLRRFVFPVCEELGLPRASWLTFRRTYSSWAHDLGVPGKVAAKLMGHANVYTTLNTYTQVMSDSLRVAAEKIGEESFGIVQSSQSTS
jgi:integrase